jgi:enoyl-CoA hydratase/carnithine racemase
LIGYQQAAKLILTGATIPAVDAVRLHLATEVAPDEELSSRLETLLSQLRSASATTLRLTKRALLIGADRGVSAGLESIETLYLTDLMATADAAEGITLRPTDPAPIHAGASRRAVSPTRRPPWPLRSKLHSQRFWRAATS